MSGASAVDTVRRYFAIWTSGDREAMEEALTEEFRFTSPQDDAIDKKAFFEQCWPFAGEIRHFDLESVVATGDQVVVRYVAHRTADGTRFRNMEVFTLREGKIDVVDVYFGRDLDVRHENTEASAIRKRYEEKAAALRDKDVVRSVELYEPYACIFDLAPPLASCDSVAERKQTVARWFATWEGPIVLEWRDLEVHVHGELAVAHALQKMSGTKTSGEVVKLWFRNTTVFRKVEGHWIVDHEHNSVPFDMTTMAACLDLRP